MEEECCDMEGDRAEGSEFINTYRDSLAVRTEDLELSEKAKLQWTKKDAPFVIAWVKELLKEAKKNNETFLEESFL